MKGQANFRNMTLVIREFLAFPYFMDQVGNGPVGVETLATLLGLTADASLHLIGPHGRSTLLSAGRRRPRR